MTATSEARRLFEKSGAFLRGHFVYASGRHGEDYLEKFRILEDPAATAQLCAMIAEHFRGQGIGLVAGPTIGGVVIAYEVARQLGARAVYAEREEAGRVFRRGFHIPEGARVLVVDDVVTTGGSVGQVVSAVERAGGLVVGIGVLAQRAEVDLASPVFACLRVDFPSFEPGACPLCAQGLGIGEKRGSS
jgi:orotate phosphoribosyltransferase